MQECTRDANVQTEDEVITRHQYETIMCPMQDPAEEQVGRFRDLTALLNRFEAGTGEGSLFDGSRPAVVSVNGSSSDGFETDRHSRALTQGASTLTSLRDLDDRGLGDTRTLPVLETSATSSNKDGGKAE